MRQAKAAALIILLICSSSRGFAGAVAPCEVVTSVVIVNGGSGYAAGDIGRPVTFTGGGGSGATGIISAVSGGAVTFVSISTLGAGYTSAPAVTISAPLGGGVTATGTAVITPLCPCGVVAALIITNGGSGYAGGDVGRPISFTGGGGSGAAAIISGVNGGGAVTNTLITNPGSGYTSAPGVTFSAPLGGGTTATGASAIGPCSVPTLPSTFLVSSVVALFAAGALFLWPGQLVLARVRKARRGGDR